MANDAAGVLGAGGHLSVPAGKLYAYKVKAFGEVAELLPVDPGVWYRSLTVAGSRSIRSHSRRLHGCTEPGGYLACAHADAGGLVGLNPIAYAREAISLAAAPKSTGPDCSAMAR